MASLLKLLPDWTRAGVYHAQVENSEIVAAAKSLRLQLFKLDLSKAKSKGGLLDLFGKTLKFPQHFGRNWDALNDCLAELSRIHHKGCVLILARADVFAEANEDAFHVALDVLDGVADYWREQKKPFWIFVEGQEDWEPDLPKLRGH
jgi:RNAse (barnase) inhibitor barstar